MPARTAAKAPAAAIHFEGIRITLLHVPAAKRRHN
jgi:hypothetical protein